MMPLLHLFKDLLHMLLHLHGPRWYHPDTPFSRWAQRERGYYIIACRRCDGSEKRRGWFGGEP